MTIRTPHRQALAIDPPTSGARRSGCWRSDPRPRRQAEALRSEHSFSTSTSRRRHPGAVRARYFGEKLPRVGQALAISKRGRVEIAPDAVVFNAISTLSRRDIEETGAVGICKFNKIMTISPRVLLQGYRWLDSLSHEYLHYVIVGLSDNKAPIWLHEGMARFYETLWRHDKARAAEDYLTPANQTLLAQALAKNSFVGFKKMEPSLIYLRHRSRCSSPMPRPRRRSIFLSTEGRRRDPRPHVRAENEADPGGDRKNHGEAVCDVRSGVEAFLKAKQLKEVEGSRVRKLRS